MPGTPSLGHFVAGRLGNLLRYIIRGNSNKLYLVVAVRGVPVKQACGLSTSPVVAERLSCFATVTNESREAAKPPARCSTARSLFKKIYTFHDPAPDYSSSNDKDSRGSFVTFVRAISVAGLICVPGGGPKA